MHQDDLPARVSEIAAAMAAAEGSPDVQLTQTRYRAALVTGLGIPAGASVLEVGCGQGDMTAVLAEAVGPEGRVVAVDIADPPTARRSPSASRPSDCWPPSSARGSSSASAWTSWTRRWTSPRGASTRWC